MSGDALAGYIVQGLTALASILSWLIWLRRDWHEHHDEGGGDDVD